MDVPKVAPRSTAAELAGLLDSPEIASLIRDLQATRTTGHPGYPLRAMVGMTLAKSMYAIPTWTRTVRLVAEHDALRAALGCEDAAPSEWACYRFAGKLSAYRPLLDACIAAVLARLREANPGMGESIAIDGSDLPAYANGQRFGSKGGAERERFSDADATWGHRSAARRARGRLLRLQAARRCLHDNGAAARMGGSHRERRRDNRGAAAAGCRAGCRVRRAERHRGQGL